MAQDPNVIVKEGGVKQDQRVLSTHEIESIERSLGAHQAILGATDASYAAGNEGATPVLPPGYSVKKRQLSDQAKQMKRALEQGRPQPIPKAEVDKYVKRAEWLKEQFVPYLETRSEIHVMKRDRAEWQSATEKARIRTQERPELERYISEWQSIMRRLEPGNPEAGNLHRLRKDR